MITIEMLSRTVAGVERADVERWIANAWIRPDGEPGSYRFHEIDVARVRLIIELRNDLGLEETALPVVLSLMDQLYETRRQVRRLCNAIEASLPEDLRQTLLERFNQP